MGLTWSVFLKRRSMALIDCSEVFFEDIFVHFRLLFNKNSNYWIKAQNSPTRVKIRIPLKFLTKINPSKPIQPIQSSVKFNFLQKLIKKLKPKILDF